MLMVAISGNTYPVKDKIKALGGRWDAGDKVWRVPEARADEARALVPPPVAAPVASKVGSLKGILDLFATAQKHLKFPAIVLSVSDAADSAAIRITVAGTSAKFPGTLNVTSQERDGEGRRKWYGRVGRDGVYAPSMSAAEVSNAVAKRLAEFASNPAKVAAEYGKLNGVCCFCSQRLGARDKSKTPSATAVRSLAVGYGKDCAEHYGLPW